MQANTHDAPVAADNSNAMTATRKRNSEHPDQQLMQQQQLQQPQHMHPRQDTSKQDPQLQQEQACTQDDGDFELMMARFDELAQQEAATPSEHPAEAAAVTTRDFNASNATAAARTAATATPMPDGSASDRDVVTPVTTTASPATSKAKAKSSNSKGTGLKRGFFAQPRIQSAATSAGIGPAAGTVQVSQPPESEPSHAMAFTGNVLEHNGSPHAQLFSPRNLVSANRGNDGEKNVAIAETAQPQKRMSKFKQSRHTQQHG